MVSASSFRERPHYCRGGSTEVSKPLMILRTCLSKEGGPDQFLLSIRWKSKAPFVLSIGYIDQPSSQKSMWRLRMAVARRNQKTHTKRTVEVRSEIQRAKREARRTSDHKSCAHTDATQKKKKRAESSAGASEERSSN
jgi:hypothetical protein